MRKQQLSNRKIWLWVMGWICIFPIPLTICIINKKDMKKAFKMVLIVIAWIFYLSIAFVVKINDTDNQNAEQKQYEEEIETTQTGDDDKNNEKTEEKADIDVENYLDDIVEKYNLQAKEQLKYVENFTPSDKNGSHYRVEFRLTAFKDAIGKSYSLGNKIVDLVATNTFSGGVDIRLYANDISVEQVIEIMQVMSPLMDDELSIEDLNKAIDEVQTKKTANGYYFGKLGILLSGTDEKGYEFMLKKE